MPVRASDLDAATLRRAGLDPALARNPRSRPRPSRSMAGGVESQWRCKDCRLTFSAWAPCERHLNDVHGGGRAELILPEPTS